MVTRRRWPENAAQAGPGGRVARVWRPVHVVDRPGGEGPQGGAWRVGARPVEGLGPSLQAQAAGGTVGP